MDQQQPKNSSVEQLGEQIKDIRVAMLTSVALNGSLHSRPMAVQQLDANGELWFFTSKDSLKTDELERNNNVNVAFVSEDDNRFVSVNGKASLVDDRAKVAELWTPFAKAWFKDGKDDPNLVLIRVDTDLAEYWASSGSILTQAVAYVKSLVTDGEPDVGEHGTLQL